MVRSSPSILLLKTHKVYLLILLFHAANSNLKKKNLAADENYFHMNVNCFIYLMDLRQNFSEVGVYFPYISCCGFTRF